MGVVLGIPVEANSLGDCVRVRIALVRGPTFLEPEFCADPPAADSRGWRIIGDVPNEDLPTHILTPSVPRGSCVWYAAASIENGLRVSAYTAPESIALDPEVGEIGGTITPTGPGF